MGKKNCKSNIKCGPNPFKKDKCGPNPFLKSEIKNRCVPCNSTFLTFTGTLPTTSTSLTLTPASTGIPIQVGQNCVVRNVNVTFTPNINAFAIDDDNNLILFNTANPSSFTTRTITGLGVDEIAVGIDFRPSNGLLYLVTTDSPDFGTGRIYTLNTTGTGAVATLVSTLDEPLVGVIFGIDFNPQTDRLRIISADGFDNYSVDVDDNPGIVNQQDILDGFPILFIAGAAYTNNVAGATSTQLYDLNLNTDVLVLQDPPASGNLTTIGPLGVAAIELNDSGFDIQTNPTTGVNTAFAIFTVNDDTGLYNINLTTGAATLLGSFGAGDLSIRGLAVAPLQSLLIVLQRNGVASGVSAVLPIGGSQVNVSSCLPVTSTDTLSIVVTDINGSALPISDSISVTLEIACGGPNVCDCVSVTGNNNNLNCDNNAVFNFGNSKCKKRC